MKIEKELLEDHQIQLNVEIDADPFEKAKRQAARKIARKVRIPGFRPGKAPYNIIIRHLGEGAIVEDALDILVEDIYPKILDEAEVKPYGPGNLENIESLDPPTFKFVVPLAPEIEVVGRGSFKEQNPPDIVGTGYVVKSLEAALWAFYRSESFQEDCLMAVNLGDDTDTTGAVYGQLAGAFYGARAIPEAWLSWLAYRDLIEAFAEQLFRLGQHRQ